MMIAKNTSKLLLLLVFFLLFFSTICSCAQADDVESEETTIHVGVYLLSIGNFEFTKGTYLVDLYLIFQWNNSQITPSSFEFMNGRATVKEKIYESLTDTSSEMWYRIQANLFITPELERYPFDTQNLKIILEDSRFNTSKLIYEPSLDFTSADDQFRIAGWKLQSYDATVTTHDYPWDEQYSRMTITIQLERDAGLTAAKLLLPPIIFCVVSGLSFFFKADKITHRLGLGTSMLISAVMFHLSQTSSLPPLPSLILIDKIMIAVYAFLASSLFATTLIYVDEEYWKDVDYTKIVNRLGSIITICLPFLVFSLLYFF